jgi:phytoene dehydrogenase-like protein
MDPVLIVGAGMAGLACATQLHQQGRPVVLLEASDRVGGRVKTDRTPDGFLLDHGFQILLSAYPEVRRQLNVAALAPRAFRSGAVIRVAPHGEFFLRDPLRDWLALPAALNAPIGSFGDKMRLAGLILGSLLQGAGFHGSAPEGSTLEFLKECGFTPQSIERFFSPFFGGVFLDRSLSVDRRFFKFVFQQFVLGRALLPKDGMEAIPLQLASGLPKEAVRLSTVVSEVGKNHVRLEDGTRLSGAAVVVAADSRGASKLLPEFRTSKDWRQTTCLYFAASSMPGGGDGYIRLNALPQALAHNVCFPSEIAPSYAPAGQTLVSVSVHGHHGLSEAVLLERVRAELGDWFGAGALEWRHLRTYVLPAALPKGDLDSARVRVHDGVYVCGDHLAYPSLNAALETGRLTAEQILETKR